MKSDHSRYSGYRFPAEIISYAIWVYHPFCLSFRDVEDLLAERGVIVSYETIRLWFYIRKLKRRQGRLGDTWHLDEVFIRINGQQQYLWRAVDQDGVVIDILVNRKVIVLFVFFTKSDGQLPAAARATVPQAPVRECRRSARPRQIVGPMRLRAEIRR